jgi:hypothetical protein
VHRGKKGCLLSKPQERVDSISNSHASRTLPLPLRPRTADASPLCLYWTIDWTAAAQTVHAGSVRRWRRTDPKQKPAQEKNDAAPKRVGSTSPTFEERSNKNSKFAHPSASKVLEAPRSPLHLSSLITTSGIRVPRGTLLSTSDTHSVSFCLTATSRTKARPIPRGHAVSQPSPLNSNLLYRLNC